MGATKIMVIRHAEKPGSYNDTQFFGVNATGDIAGKDGKKQLITTGWQRAGGLVTLFAPPWGPKAGLAKPAYLFASDPESKSNGSDGNSADDSGPSQRPYQTLTPLEAALGLTIDVHYKKSHYDKMVEKALSREGVVLIAWQHEDIALQTEDKKDGISQVILTQTQTPDGKFNIPKTWPSGSQGARYDLIFVFDRPAGTGPITNFSLIGQMLLHGDAPPPG
jgi:hypothetical protein